MSPLICGSWELLYTSKSQFDIRNPLGVTIRSKSSFLLRAISLSLLAFSIRKSSFLLRAFSLSLLAFSLARAHTDTAHALTSKCL